MSTTRVHAATAAPPDRGPHEDDGWIDASVRLAPGTPEWPGDTPYACGWTARIAEGSTVNLSAISLSPHVGTHADAPLHVDDAWPASDALPVDAFVGPCVVIDLSDLAADASPDGRGTIALATLRERAVAQGVTLDGAPRVLLRTGRTVADGRFPEAWPWLAPACARALTAAGLRLLGVDAPSVDARESRDLATHRALFAAGACNLENLDLRGATPGRYDLVAPPVRVVGLDGAPVRALLRPIRAPG